jgi:SAM-dependent methyltransferase
MKIYELETALAYLRLPAQSTLVDICCGTGIQSQLLARQASRVIGIDNDRGKIRDASWHLQHSRYHGAVSFVIGQAEELPLPDSAADAVVCLCAIEHIPRPEDALREVVRILKPGGMLCITADSLANVARDSLRAQHQKMYAVYRYFDVKSLSDVLRGAGLCVDVAFPMLCSPEAVKELERCMTNPNPYGPIRTRRLLTRLRLADAALADRTAGLFVFAAATKPTLSETGV